jgi:iron complex transport system ATP-binding protein
VTTLLEARQLCVERGGRPVLEGVDLALQAGEALALVGPNAAGKSTLIRALAGLLPERSGCVLLQGRPLVECPRSLRARTLALVAADLDSRTALSVQESVRLGRYPHRGPFTPMRPHDNDVIERVLRQTGVWNLRQRSIATLSAGEKQRVALARGLAQEPAVLLLDEPAAHLDVGHGLQLFRMLDDVRTRGVAVLAVVHDLQRAALWAERVALLADGRIAGLGPPDEVLLSSACAQAFGVRISAHRVPGQPRPLLTFEDEIC